MGGGYTSGANVNVYYIHGCSGNDGNSGDNNHFGSTGAWKTIQYALDQIAADHDGTTAGNEYRIMQTNDDSTYYQLGGAHQTDVQLVPAWSQYHEPIITGSNMNGDVDGTQVMIGGSGGGTTLGMLQMGVQTIDRASFANIHFNGGDTAHWCVFARPNNHYIDWVNCRFSQAVDDGCNSVYGDNVPLAERGGQYWTFSHCRFDNNGGMGYRQHTSYASYGVFYKCLFDHNDDVGGYFGYYENIIGCVFANNGGDGCRWNNSGALMADCVFHENGGDGLAQAGATNMGQRINCIFSNNDHWGVNYQSTPVAKSWNDTFYGNTYGDFSYAAIADTSLFMYTHGERGHNPNFLDPAAANHPDFTTGSDYSGHGLGMPTPFKVFGSTSDDPGTHKWVKTETTSIF